MFRHPGRQKVVKGLMEKAPFARFDLQNICHVAPSPAWHRVSRMARGSHGPCDGTRTLTLAPMQGGEQTGVKCGFEDHEFYIYIFFCLWNSEFSLFPRRAVGGITGGIACRRHCPERFSHPSLLVPTRCGGI